MWSPPHIKWYKTFFFYSLASQFNYEGCIPCQEEGNIPFVVDNGVGSFSTKPEDIAGTVASWFSDEYSTFLAEMSEKAKKLGRPEATFKIVKDLAGKLLH